MHACFAARIGKECSAMHAVECMQLLSDAAHACLVGTVWMRVTVGDTKEKGWELFTFLGFSFSAKHTFLQIFT